MTINEIVIKNEEAIEKDASKVAQISNKNMIDNIKKAIKIKVMIKKVKNQSSEKEAVAYEGKDKKDVTK